MGISTDYRDNRKSAYQEFSIVSDFNACRLPKGLSLAAAAPLGVAFVAAALALGVCLGVDFSKTTTDNEGPDLFKIIRSLPRTSLPEDIRGECFDGIDEEDRPQPGDWIAIWGGKIPCTS
jgi:NADPH:quinone reductase-like Zn-dependent oxidoreductase